MYVLSNVDRVIVLSNTWRNWVEEEFPRARVEVVHNPVELTYSSRADRVSNTVLFLGRLGNRKGTFDLLHAVARIKVRFPEVHLLLGGDGDLDGVRDVVISLGLVEHVSLLGWVEGEQKNELLTRATVFVLPSYAEGLPMSLLEAMAAGLPVVTTPVGGIPELVTDGIEGFLVEPGNVDALAERLGRLLDDSAMCERMGDAGLAKVRTQFAVESVLPRLIAVYKDVRPGVELSGVRDSD